MRSVVVGVVLFVALSASAGGPVKAGLQAQRRGDVIGSRLSLGQAVGFGTDKGLWRSYLQSVYAAAGVYGNRLLITDRLRHRDSRDAPVLAYFAGRLAAENDSNPGRDPATAFARSDLTVYQRARLTVVTQQPKYIAVLADLAVDLPRIGRGRFSFPHVEQRAHMEILVNGPVRITLSEQVVGELEAWRTLPRAEISVHTGDLEIRAGYGFLEDERLPPLVLRTERRAGLFAGWTLTPSMAVFLDARFDEHAWDQPNDLDRVDSTPIRARAGWIGAFGRLDVVAAAGYGNSLHDSGEDFSNAIGRVEVSARLDDTLVTAGFERDFETSLWANYLIHNEIFAKLEARFKWVTLQLAAGVDFQRYAHFEPDQIDPVAGFGAVVSDPERTQSVLTLGFQVDFEMTWATITFGLELENGLSDWTYTHDLGFQTFSTEAAYKRAAMVVRLNFHN